MTTRLCLLLACLSTANPAHAQRAVDLQVGRWSVSGPDLTHYSAALWHDFWGPFGYSLRGQALIASDSAGRSLYGLGPEITLLRGLLRDGPLSIYGVGGTGLVLGVGASSAIGAIWNAGAGVELRAPAWFAATLEVRRFAEDDDFRGFWDLAAADRRGWMVNVGFSVRWGGTRPTPRPVEPGPPIYRPTAPAGNGGSVDSPATAAPPPAALASRVVETALAAMGEPYRWGGTGTDEGFDCSGLVWYAYTSHGVDVPRVSRDQARSGQPVAADVAVLQPGDILLFADRPGVVTHVGLYIGEARFIHATTSGGVRVGSLGSAADANDRWYLSRWVGARRILD